ncbi:helix-turn-helix domain-containing protein [Nocardia cyriacigeorgica]|uniref:Helix-turn-helix domain-containing protein n=1 Tax=Nocardia cyriacigeorgica TaxID=135487 RepID=A0ABX0CY53_9NOCA|nr:helix-turn-helix transcriptional regulator [Nocardia cyriacigeorgica]NEW58682.1 helix-turn-helix domain-containing protein [Nocardia cyriacigeorgica]
MTTGSTLPRRILARQLRALRDKSGVSAETARREIGVSKQTLWRMENGLPVKLNPLFIRRLCEIYGAPEDLTMALLALAEEAKAKGWWHAFDDAIPQSFGLFVGLEDAAHHIVSFQTTLIPGLLQTAEYRRALSWIDSPNSPTEQIETGVAIGVRRQLRLTNTRHPLALDVFIDETILRRVTGSTAIMADQLRHLEKTARLPNVSIRVIPSSVGSYRGLIVGPFVLLEFPQHPTAYLTEPPVVFVQGFTGDLYLDRPEEIERYREVCTDLKRLALDEAESRALCLELAEEFDRVR